MAFGPTQNYHDASLGVWKGRPILAAATRTLIAVVPVALTVGFGLAAVQWFPPRRLGVNPWLWMLAEIACATVVLVLATRLALTLRAADHPAAPRPVLPRSCAVPARRR